jgi:hypothetical protein
MNRVVSAVLGEQMSRAMFSVPESLARRMEAPSMIRAMGKLMAPFLAGGIRTKHEPGITAKLFREGSKSLHLLPTHLQGSMVAGEQRSNALERLYPWAKAYEEDVVEQGVVSKEAIDLLDNPSHGPPEGLRPSQVTLWATTTMRKAIAASLVRRKDETKSQDIANLLCLETHSPQCVYNSTHWRAVTKSLGEEQARNIVLWWSLRETFRRAQGLGILSQDRNSTTATTSMESTTPFDDCCSDGQ